MRFSAAIATAVALLGPATALASPILNAGFETGTLAPWFQGAGTLDYPFDEYWSTTSATAASGSWSAQNVGNNELRQDFAALPVASIAEISFFLRKEGVIGLETAVQLHYDDGSRTQVLVLASEFDLWERHDVTDALEPGKQLSGVSFFGVRTDVGTRTYIDDVMIVVPEPATGVLLASGLALFAFRRRGEPRSATRRR